MKRLTQLFDTYLYYYLLAIVLIMPLHAFLSISLGQITGQQAVLQAWKEVGLVLGGIAAAGLVITKKTSRDKLLQQPAVWAVGAFILTALLVSLANRSVGIQSFLLGAKTTLAFLVMFMVMQTVTFTKQRWNILVKALLAISSAVGVFAVAQVFLLPADYLARFGYNASTVIPFHLVDPALAAPTNSVAL
jgi:hypothetical protein